MNKISTEVPTKSGRSDQNSLENRCHRLANTDGDIGKKNKGNEIRMDKHTERRSHRRLPEEENSQDMNKSYQTERRHQQWDPENDGTKSINNNNNN